MNDIASASCTCKTFKTCHVVMWYILENVGKIASLGDE